MQRYKGLLALTVGLAALLAFLRPAPVAYAQMTRIVQVSAGKFHTCALFSDATVYCWGGNLYGQSKLQTGPFTRITAGGLYTCGLKSDGSVQCWGDNKFGQATAQAGPFTQINAGWGNTCGLKANGYVDCWGMIAGNEAGPYPSQYQINGLRKGPFTQVEVSNPDACALTPSAYGTPSRPAGVYCWGDSIGAPYGEVADQFGSYTQVAVGGNFNCALESTGSADCWGSNVYGQSSPPPDTFLDLSAGNLFACGLRTDHTVACWGYNFYGQVKRTPVGTFKGVTVGFAHACAWNDYDVVCWGRNDEGQTTPNLCVGATCGTPPKIFAFQGFYPPLKPEQTDPPKLNVVEAGSAVPLKFSLGGYKGMSVIAGGTPTSRPLDCDQFEPWGFPEPAQSAGHHGLIYDPRSGSYVYVWKTDPDWAGSCRVLSLKLTDGTEHLVALQFQ